MKKREIIVLGSDHAGFGVKEYVKNLLLQWNYRVEDVGTFNGESVDYPDFAEKAAVKVSAGRNKKGILACGTGIGMSMAANKVPGVRAALVHTVRNARASREHNDANILVLGGRPYDGKKVKKIVNTWLNTRFLGGRHVRRVNKIMKIGRKYRKK